MALSFAQFHAFERGGFFFFFNSFGVSSQWDLRLKALPAFGYLSLRPGKRTEQN